MTSANTAGPDWHTAGRGNMTTRRIVAVAAAIIVLVAAMLVPFPPSLSTIRGMELTNQGRAALASLAFALVLWIAEAMPFHITGLLAVLIMTVLGAGTYTDIVRYGFGDDEIGRAHV